METNALKLNLNKLIIERENLKNAYYKKLLTTADYVEAFTAISKRIKALQLIN